MCTHETTKLVGRKGVEVLSRDVSQRAKGREIGVSLATPPKLRRLQEALYTKAKQDRAPRVSPLYDKVDRADILAHAYALSRQHGGAPGVDGVTFEDIEAAGLERWLAAVQEALRIEASRPQSVRRVVSPKPGGTGERPLGIPVIRDRVVHTAALLSLQPIVEADLNPRPMAIGRAGRRWRPSRRCIGRCAPGRPRWWTPTCRSTSTRFRTRTCWSRWLAASAIEGCFGC